MRKRILSLFCIVLACVLLLSGCSLRKRAEVVTATPAPVVTIAPVETAAPAPETPEPEASPEPAAVIVSNADATAAPVETAAPTPEPTPAPTPEATPAPAPTEETVIAGGSCWFVAKYENAIWAEWHFVSPDGSKDLDYTQVVKEFPKLTIDKGFASTTQLSNIPVEMNGWKAYCRFSNNSGAVKTDMAKITVTTSAEGAPKVTKSPTGETVKAGESAYFVAKQERAEWAVWHFVSPDGSKDLDYTQAAKEFPKLQIINGDQGTMQLKNIPAELNGWKVYCAFRNNIGTTKTDSATITVKS